MQNRNWKILDAPADCIISLQKELGIHYTLCQLLVLRGIKTFQEAKDYFRPDLNELHDPFLMKDMDKAVKRVIHAISNNEKMLVYGDYDVDGTTSVSLMYQGLLSVAKVENISYYIPHRYREGYGVSKAGIDHAISEGIKLIICLDCGIKSVELIQYAAENQIDFIVCDHHLPGDVLPPAVAILNAKQSGCNYPYKELSGCGVGFKLICALYSSLNADVANAYQYLSLVAIAIAADIVPITGENRIMAYHGLQLLNTEPLAGINALLKLSSAKYPVTISNLVFALAPRINAAGRMDDAKKVVKLLICPDKNEALVLAEALHNDNIDRKEVDVAMTEMALQMIKDDTGHASKKSTVLYNEEWHKGVVGIVASRVIEKYYRPTILLTLSNGLATGSARSVHGFNVYDAIHSCSKHLTNFGGHFAAAGLSMLPESVEAFSAQFESIVSSTINEDCCTPRILIDSEIKFSDITPVFYNIIKQMEPYGPENMRPIFVSKNVKDNGYSKVVKDVHLRTVLTQENCIMTGIGFNMAEKFSLIANGSGIDIVYTLEENEWNDSKSIQMKIIDIRKTELGETKSITA